MWIRSAFWVGTVKAGREEEFRTAMNRELVPGLRNLPGVRAAKALWPQRLEHRPPKIACQILVEFDSEADVDRMLASPERTAMRARVLEIAELFDGALSHIDYQTA
jgi:antibiotic biosynthesis monooxygenase (ABM) superfamily enzyme